MSPVTKLSGPTWRRLKMAMEFKFRGIPFTKISDEDQIKTLGLLAGLAASDRRVLYDEALQADLGRRAAAQAEAKAPKGGDEDPLAARIEELARAVALERFVPP